MKACFAAYCLLALSAGAFGSGMNAKSYQKGTIAIPPSSTKKSCELQFGDAAVQFSGCDDFKDGEAVEYREEGSTLFIRSDNAKESKHKILARILKHDPSYKPIVWSKGTIVGYGVQRVPPRSNGNGSSLNIAFGGGKIKVYELRGAEATYYIDHCGFSRQASSIPVRKWNTASMVSIFSSATTAPRNTIARLKGKAYRTLSRLRQCRVASSRTGSYAKECRLSLRCCAEPSSPFAWV